jgi:hypothetical protein
VSYNDTNKYCSVSFDRIWDRLAPHSLSSFEFVSGHIPNSLIDDFKSSRILNSDQFLKYSNRTRMRTFGTRTGYGSYYTEI